MKAMKRRLLSLLLAMAMVCTLVPSALAEGEDSLSFSGSITANGEQQTATATVSGTNSKNWASATGLSGSCKTNGVSVGDVSFSNGSFSIPVTATTAVAAGTVEITITGTLSASGSSGTEGTGGEQTQSTTPSTITAKGNLTITAAQTSYSVTPGTLSLTVGGSNGTVSVTPAGGNNIKFTSSQPKVATVNETTGVVTPVAEGTTEITATVNNVDADGKCIVTVKNPAVTAIGNITPTTNTFQANGEETFTLTVTSNADKVTKVVWTCDKPGFIEYKSETTLLTGSTTNLVKFLQTGKVTLTATMQDASGNAIGTAKKDITITSPLTISPEQKTLSYYGDSVILTAYYGGKEVTSNVSWGIVDAQGNSLNNGYVTLETLNTGKAAVTSIATASRSNATIIRVSYLGYTADCSIYTTYSGANFATASVYSDNGGYALGDLDDAGKSSIVDQLDSYFYSTTNGRYGVAYVRFTSTTSGNYGSLSANTNYEYYVDRYTSGTSNRSLRDVVFYPGTAKGSASFPVTVYYYTGNSASSNTSSVSGTITFNVTEGTSTGDITYTASIGDDVYFDMGDFEDLYYTKTSRGTLDRVTFSMPSGGYLYSDRNRLSSSNATCYVSPRSTENDLSSVYFSPTGTTASKAGTVRVGFTAYGNRSNVSGTVAITYLNGAAKDISYSTVNGSVTLDQQDFIDAYKEVTGKTAPSTLTIQFQEVPSNGTLTYTGGSRDVNLTKSNVRSNKYSTKTTGSYRLNQLTYTGTKGTDTIEYIAYSGSAAQFTGKVVFNGTAAVPTDVVVTYGSTGGQAVTFSQNDFVRANSVMSNAAKVRFVTPTNGALTMSGANAAGIDIASSLLGSVSYKPKAGFNGTDRIIFAAYDSRNQLVASGSVNITVVGNTSTTTTTPGGVTDVSQFKDVSATAWYRSDLATLVSQGIITGKGEGKFDPLGTVTYGEALKMILEACGYTATLGTGSNWAINYKNLAVSNGWISSSIDLNAAISRNATAELAARVMGVAPATGGSPFADDANAYAVALYYTNPQIFVGDNTTGKLLFKNGSPLLRQEVCAVICRVRNYHTQHTTNTMPDGI